MGRMTDRRILKFILPAVFGFLMSFASPAFGGEIITPDAVSGTDFQVHVKSMKELRELRTVHQTYDFSCGAASVATLLTFSYDRPTTEHEVFDKMWEVGDREHIQKYGFSLLDMQKYLASRGMHAVGYKISMDRLRRLHVPAIALINPNGYNHFVVVRGWRNGAAIVADPVLGLRRMPEDDFKSVWNGIVFLLKDDQKLAESHYNDPADFDLIPRSVLASGMQYAHGDIGLYLMNIPIFNDF